MKKSLLTVIATIALLAATKASAAFTNNTVLPVTFQITAISVTNTAVSVTNSAHTVTSTVRSTTNVLTTANFLQMIATEFETSFPTGARLVLGPDLRFYVTDATGAPLLNAGSNPSDSQYYFGVSNNIVADTLTKGTFIFGKGVNYTNGNSQLLPINIVSSDYFVCYRDSHTNDFHFGGALIYTYTENSTPTNAIKPNVNLTISGAGGGEMIHPKTHSAVPVLFPKAQMTATGQKIVGD